MSNLDLKLSVLSLSYVLLCSLLLEWPLGTNVSQMDGSVSVNKKTSPYILEWIVDIILWIPDSVNYYPEILDNILLIDSAWVIIGATK